MNNDIISDNSSIDNIDIIDNTRELSVSASPYDYYSYYDVVSREDTIIENQNKVYDLVNQGFTFLSFIIIIYFLYMFIKNMIRK